MVLKKSTTNLENIFDDKGSRAVIISTDMTLMQI